MEGVAEIPVMAALESVFDVRGFEPEPGPGEPGDRTCSSLAYVRASSSMAARAGRSIARTCACVRLVRILLVCVLEQLELHGQPYFLLIIVILQLYYQCKVSVLC